MVGGSYKQQCPSCETMVLIKSPALAGKKIECPRCKDRFIVAKPAPAKPAESDDDDNGAEETPAPAKSANLRAGKPPIKKPGAKADNGADKAAVQPRKPSLTKLQTPNPESDDDDVPLKPGKGAGKKPAQESDDDEENVADTRPAKQDARVKPGAPTKKPAAKPPAPASDDGEEEAPPHSETAANETANDEEKPDEPNEENQENEEEETKSRFGINLKNKKMALGLGLSVVGVVVLAAAAYFILVTDTRPTPGIKQFRPPGPFVAPQPPPIVVAKADDKKKGIDLKDKGVKDKGVKDKGVKDKDGKDKGVKDKSAKDKDGKDKVETSAKDKGGETKDPNDDPANSGPELPAGGPELTNLIPPDAEQVVRICFKNLLDSSGPFNDAIFNAFSIPGPFIESHLKKRLGFDVNKIDEIYQAERFSGTPWSFTVVHVTEALDMDRIAAALGAQQVKKPIAGQTYYQLTDNPWIEQLGRLAPGVPPSLRLLLPTRHGRPLYVRKHTIQTLVLADEQPMMDFLKVEGQFRFYGDKVDPKKTADPKKPDAGPGTGTYMTIKPDLKALVEKTYLGDGGAKLIFTAGTDLAAARTASKLPQHRGLTFYRPRPFWDFTCLLQERKPTLKAASTSLITKGPRIYEYRTELESTPEDVSLLKKEIDDVAVPRIIQLAEQLLQTKLELVGPDGKQYTTQRIATTQAPASIGVNIVMGMDKDVYSRVGDLLALLMIDARDELTLAEKSDAELRRQLARAGKQVAVTGIENRVDAGQFPPGAFIRAGKDRVAREPGNRISWLAALLPYLGQERLYERLEFDASWQDPRNLAIGRTCIPQFLDPTYPDWSRFVAYPELPVELATTHYVGVAGVGLDAADLPLGHPKRGILGYDQSAKLTDVQKGRGLSNTMLMIQVPPDSLAGVTPWIAGGGSTLRGVPEKNSIEPFVLTKDRQHKPIQFQGRSGTYAVMADGSVRFISSTASDAVVQSMATYQASDIDLDKEADTPRVSAPEVEKKSPQKKK